MSYIQSCNLIGQICFATGISEIQKSKLGKCPFLSNEHRIFYWLLIRKEAADYTSLSGVWTGDLRLRYPTVYHLSHDQCFFSPLRLRLPSKFLPAVNEVVLLREVDASGSDADVDVERFYRVQVWLRKVIFIPFCRDSTISGGVRCKDVEALNVEWSKCHTCILWFYSEGILNIFGYNMLLLSSHDHHFRTSWLKLWQPMATCFKIREKDERGGRKDLCNIEQLGSEIGQLMWEWG